MAIGRSFGVRCQAIPELCNILRGVQVCKEICVQSWHAFEERLELLSHVAGRQQGNHALIINDGAVKAITRGWKTQGC